MRIKLHLTVSKLLNRRRQIKVQCITQGASLKENLKFYIVVANKIWNFWNLFCKIICSKSDFSIQLTVALCSESDGFRHSWPRIHWTAVSSHHKRLWRFKIKNWQKKKKKISSGFGHFLLDAQDYRLFTARRNDAFINGLSSCIDSLYARLFWPHTLPIQFKASIIWQNVMAIFSIEFSSFARFSQIPAAGAGGDGAGGACNRKFTVSYRKRKLSSCLEGQKVLHKRCMNIKQNYILASHASTLADMFVWNLF